MAHVIRQPCDEGIIRSEEARAPCARSAGPWVLALVPNSLALIGASFEEARRAKAIGTWAGFTAVTMVLGPLLGGYLTEHLS